MKIKQKTMVTPVGTQDTPITAEEFVSAVSQDKKIQIIGNIPESFASDDSVKVALATITELTFGPLATIGAAAFSGGGGVVFTALTAIYFTNVTEIKEKTFEKAQFPVLTTMNGSDITKMGESAFSEANFSVLTTLSFPNLLAIPKRAFLLLKCPNLTSLDFPLVTSIGEEAFSGSFFGAQVQFLKLTSVSFPRVTEIKDSAFAIIEFTTLTSLDFPLVSKVEKFAFAFSQFKALISLRFLNDKVTLAVNSFTNTDFLIEFCVAGIEVKILKARVNSTIPLQPLIYLCPYTPQDLINAVYSDFDVTNTNPLINKDIPDNFGSS